MKREFLQSIKIGDQPLSKEIIDAIMDENGKDIEGAKKPFMDYDSLKNQLSEANKTIEGFKALDIDGIKKAADDWKLKAETAERDAAVKLADMEFNGLLEATITAVKGKNAKALRGLLDVDALKASKNQSEDIKAALEKLKESDGYLFEDVKPADQTTLSTGLQHQTPLGADGDSFVAAAMKGAGLSPAGK